MKQAHTGPASHSRLDLLLQRLQLPEQGRWLQPNSRPKASLVGLPVLQNISVCCIGGQQKDGAAAINNLLAVWLHIFPKEASSSSS